MGLPFPDGSILRFALRRAPTAVGNINSDATGFELTQTEYFDTEKPGVNSLAFQYIYGSR